MSALSSVQKAAKAQADSLMESAMKQIETMDGSYQALFPFKSLAEASSQFSSGGVAVPNDALVKALSAAQEAIDATVSSGLLLERYIMLTIPKMEDGNNFGVTVQLTALKQMKDDREKLEKILEELSKYSATRADAMEKCKLPTTNQSKTTSQTTSNADSKGGEKAGVTSSNETKTEEKTVESANQIAEASFRQQSVWAVDALYYSKARNAFVSAVTCFMTAVDFMDKNKVKIDAPRGTSGGHSSMY